jgi:hypothetical protein
MTEDDGKHPAVPFYAIGVEIYLGLKISKDGESRKEDVEVLRNQYDQDGLKRRTGAKTRAAIEEIQKELEA